MKQLAFHVERPIYRLSNGRFASKEMSYADKQNSEKQTIKT